MTDATRIDVERAGRDRRARAHRAHRGRHGDRRRVARSTSATSGAARDRAAIAEYYRSRQMACVVFSVDERLSGRPQVPNDVVAEFAAENADVAIAFASLDPTRGPEAVREARRLVDAGLVRGLKLHPPLQQFFPNDRIAYPLYEVFAEARLPVLFHTGHSGIGTGMPGGGGDPPEVRPPDADRRRGGRLPRHADHHGAPVVSLAGRGDLGVPAQAAGLHRPVGLVAEVLLADADPVREHAAEAQGAVRLGLPADHARTAGWPISRRSRIRDEVRPLILRENAIRLFGLAGA